MKTTVRATAWPVGRLASLQKESKIYLDDSFQSYSRWVIETNQKYMRSLLEGRAPTPITLGKISTLRDNIEISFFFPDIVPLIPSGDIITNPLILFSKILLKIIFLKVLILFNFFNL